MTSHSVRKAAAAVLATTLLAATTVPVQANVTQASRGAVRSAVTDARDAADRLATKREKWHARHSHFRR
jgi:hypothetical protein